MRRTDSSTARAGREMSLADGLLARKRHTLYAPGTPDECRQLIEVGTAEDASGRLNLRAFRVDWSSAERASIRTAEGLPRTTTRVRPVPP